MMTRKEIEMLQDIDLCKMRFLIHMKDSWNSNDRRQLAIVSDVMKMRGIVGNEFSTEQMFGVK